MRWLKREEGASMVLVALLLVVLLALAGIAIDLGAMYAERRQLRNAADAAVLAIAEDCGTGAQPCNDATAYSTAGSYADSNAEDGAAGVEALDLDLGEQTVRLRTFAVDPSGEEGVKTRFMQILGFDRMDVSANAGALWGHPSEGRGIPIIFEECEWWKAEGYGPAHTITMMFHEGSTDDDDPDCPRGPAGKDAPGGFGWLDTIEGICESLIVNGYVWADVGNEPSKDCKDSGGDILRDAIYNKDILIPLYKEVFEQGSHTRYLVTGFAAFHVTAYKLGANKYTEPRGFSCPEGPGGSGRCIQGYYTQDTIYHGEPGGGDFGVLLVKLFE